MKSTNAPGALRKAGLGAAAAPVMVALVVRWVAGGAPTLAGAASDDSQTVKNQLVPLPTLSEKQRRALAFATSALDQPMALSPMRAVVMEPQSTQDDQSVEGAQVQTPALPALPPAPSFAVTAVMVSARHSLATINGKLRRIGDEIESGWRLKRINIAEGVVVIVSEDGRRVLIPIRKATR